MSFNDLVLLFPAIILYCVFTLAMNKKNFNKRILGILLCINKRNENKYK